jgi:hypothetical protein
MSRLRYASLGSTPDDVDKIKLVRWWLPEAQSLIVSNITQALVALVLPKPVVITKSRL